MTISFNGLGNEGRLGNQIFQYAFIRGLAAKTGYDWMIPPDGSDRFDNYGLFECFELTGCEKTGEGRFQTLECRDTLFHPEIFTDARDDINYSGTYQTEKYFEHIDTEIRKDLTFKKVYLDPCQEFVDSLGGRDNCIFLHIRRGNPNITGRRGEKWSYQMLQELSLIHI